MLERLITGAPQRADHRYFRAETRRLHASAGDQELALEEDLRAAIQIGQEPSSTAWNQFERGLGDDTPTWTKEGITIDALQFYVGIKDGGLLAATPSNTKGVAPLVFKAGMQPAEVVALYQGLVTRDGSSFTLNRIAPADFVGVTGFRFEYELTRKIDDVRLQGVAYAGVRNGELFMINYSAPRLRFFATYAPQAETLARSARVKS